MEKEYEFGTCRVYDREAEQACQARWDAIGKPLHSLGELERIFTRIAGMTGKTAVSVRKKAILVFCADNGVVEEGISQSDSSVTSIVAANMAAGKASVNLMSAVSGTEVIPVDIGMKEDVDHPAMRQEKIARGTRNFAKEPAMTENEVRQAIQVGMRLVKECKEAGYDLLGTGEMGIGNTTTSSAVLSVLLQKPVREVTGAGAGLSRAGVAHKCAVIEEALLRYRPKAEDVISLLSYVGGLDIAGLTGVFLGGAVFGMPIVLDGLITAAAALCAERLLPGSRQFMIASHLGKEPACEAVLKELSLTPVLHAGLALGEGSGAAAFFACLMSAAAVFEENRTFSDIRVEPYKEWQ